MPGDVAWLITSVMTRVCVCVYGRRTTFARGARGDFRETEKIVSLGGSCSREEDNEESV